MNPGIFTTIKVIHGKPLFLDKHSHRLITQAKALKLPIPEGLDQQLLQYIKDNKLTDCAVRITITSKIPLTIEHRFLPPAVSTGTVITITDSRDRLKIYKTTNRTVNEQAKALAEKHDAQDAIFVQNGNLIESTIANIFSLNEKGNIITPPITDKGLDGITRQIIMEQLPVFEEHIPEQTTQPLVLVNSLRIQKVTHLNSRKLPNAEKLVTKIEKALSPRRAPATNMKTSDGGEARQDPQMEIFYKKLSFWIDPEKVFQKLFSHFPQSFWLDSSLTNDTARFSYMGIPQKIITYALPTNTVTIQEGEETTQLNQDIFTYLEKELANNIIRASDLPFDFIGGYVGYFGYELKHLTSAKKTHNSPYHDSLWYFTKQILVFDHKEKNFYLVCLDGNTEWITKTQEALEKLSHTEHAKKSHNKTDGPQFTLHRQHKQYLTDIKTCKEYLAQGDSYQICLTNTFTTQTIKDPFALYQTLRKTNPAPYAAYIKYKELVILCSSPEQFLGINKNRHIQTKPIKGTIKRGRTPESDKMLRQQLVTSKKDWSENAMIVDLLRNDLGKVCQFGSITVEELMAVESYQTVHHLVSTIRGQLRDDASIIDAVKACFPGGSMTGVPKIRTMEILENIEKKARGIYSGSLGFLSLNNTAQLNIVIRTIVAKGNHLEIGAGGAILIDSDPEKEYEEMVLKAEALIHSVQGRL